MKTRISRAEIDELASKLGLFVHRECGGFRIMDGKNKNIYPNNGICPVTSLRECYTFLLGVKHASITTNQMRIKINRAIDALL